jgi:hypothetical protein
MSDQPGEALAPTTALVFAGVLVVLATADAALLFAG